MMIATTPSLNASRRPLLIEAGVYSERYCHSTRQKNWIEITIDFCFVLWGFPRDKSWKAISRQVPKPAANREEARRAGLQLESGLPQLLQKRAEASGCVAPHDPHERPTRRLAPQPEQKAEPALFAAPHVPHRPGSGGT